MQWGRAEKKFMRLRGRLAQFSREALEDRQQLDPGEEVPMRDDSFETRREHQLRAMRRAGHVIFRTTSLGLNLTRGRLQIMQRISMVMEWVCMIHRSASADLNSSRLGLLEVLDSDLDLSQEFQSVHWSSR